MIRNLLAFVCCVMFLAHITVGMQPFVAMFDLGVAMAEIPYVLAIPAMAFFTLYMLRV
jgi:hypothetical protein